LLSGLEALLEMGADRVDIFSDSQLVVQQIKGEMQCMDGTLNEYREKCLEMLSNVEERNISYVSREKNVIANMLAQQALGYDVREGKFEVKTTPGTSSIMAQEIRNGVDHNTKLGKVDGRVRLMDRIKAQILQTMQQTMANIQQAQGHQPAPQPQQRDKLGEF
jgi:hypothetical protein